VDATARLSSAQESVHNTGQVAEITRHNALRRSTGERLGRRRAAGVTGFFSARARSRGRTSRVAKRRMSWAWPSPVMLAK